MFQDQNKQEEQFTPSHIETKLHQTLNNRSVLAGKSNLFDKGENKRFGKNIFSIGCPDNIDGYI